MRKMILVALIIFVVVYWTEVSNFVVGNASTAGNRISHWLVDHTPKK